MSSEPMGPVVVGIDGSPASVGALDLAAEEAVARVTPLLVVHADEGGARPETGRDLLDAAVERVRSEHPSLAVATEAVPGGPVDALLSRAEGACLLVLGHRGRYHPGPSTLGSVALAVIDRAHGAVIVHRPLDTTTRVALPRPVLVGVAPGPAVEAVVEFGFVEASQRGTALHAVYVWAEAGAWDPAEIHADHSGVATGQTGAELALAEVLAGWSAKYPDVPVSRTARHGLDATIALTAASRSAQLVVVGSPHVPGESRVLAGSVAHGLVHRAGCPVAVIDPG